ncbi:hypothetical protein NQ314_006907 [Rhamnusium bicolor]|uniref:RING-type domain-containing protein n=1 Tax=Rhamnusium bicolor TaxID=1586634 RepID=A0AAV8YUW1_9CUCU|nr:hypothetical protein NQ314_006907 [Rhamnusium bicolor]
MYRNIFEDLMERFLQKKYLGYQPLPVRNEEVSKCDYCELPLNVPILNEVRKCEFGHIFHSLCFIHIQGICSICITRA